MRFKSAVAAALCVNVMKLRILCISVLITFAGILAYSFVSAELYYDSSVDGMRGTLSVYMNAFDESYYALDADAADAFSQKLDGARITFIAEDGSVLADSAAAEITENHLGREEVKNAVKDGEGYAVRRSATVGIDYVYYCRRFSYSQSAASVAQGNQADAAAAGADYYMVRIAVPVASEWAMFADTLPTVIIYLIIDLFACVIFTYVATYFILRPVENLTRQAALSDRINTRFKELQSLAEILNDRNKDIERKMNEIKEEKELVEKAQNSKNEFISNITHEMNTPLTSIRGYAELLASGMMNKDQQDAAYKTILKQSERLTNLIACIINYNEIDNSDVPACDVDLSKLAKEMLAVVKPEADKRKVTLIDKISDNVIVQSTHERMSEMVGNLIRNAIRYNKVGGSVTVTLDIDHFEVADTGIGISEENLNKVFSRFFTVDKSHSGKNGGFGLGLAMVKKICQREGWRISVKSKEGEGSVFTVKF